MNILNKNQWNFIHTNKFYLNVCHGNIISIKQNFKKTLQQKN